MLSSGWRRHLDQFSSDKLEPGICLAIEPMFTLGSGDVHVERDGWTVTWKGRGWDRSFEDYLDLVRAAGGTSDPVLRQRLAQRGR